MVDKYNNVQDLFVDVMHKHGRHNIVMPTPYPGSILDLPLERELEIMPALKRQLIVNIAKQAAHGDLTSMYTISRFYTVGLGLPRSVTKAFSWAKHSLMESGTLSFDESIRELKKDVRALSKETWVYPKVLDKIYAKMLPQYKEIDIDELPRELRGRKSMYYVSPMLSGVRTFLVYRVDTESKRCYLYDVRCGGIEGKRLSLDVAQFLDIPKVLGDIRKRSTIPDYLLVGYNT